MHTNICLIGSTRFEEIFGEENKIILDYVQKEKIRQSDLVLVIDKDKYIGSSTKNQIEYAKFLNKRVLYYSKGDVKKL